MWMQAREQSKRNRRIGTTLALSLSPLTCFCAAMMSAHEESESGQSEPAPLVLLHHLADTSGSGGQENEEESSEEAEQSSTVILNSSIVLLDEDVLAQLNPWGTDIAELPLITLELFSDVQIDVRMLTGRPLWRGIEPWDGEQVVEPNAFIISGEIVSGAAGGYVVLFSTADAVYANAYLDGVGSMRIRSESSSLYSVKHIATNGDFECNAESVGSIPQLAILGESGGGSSGFSALTSTGCDEDHIDIMFLYTPDGQEQSETECEGSCTPSTCLCSDDPEPIDVRIRLAVGEANQAFRRSSAHSTLDLLRVVWIGPLGQNDTSSFGVPWFDGLDWIYDMRNAIRADLLSVITAGPSGGAPQFDQYTPAAEILGRSILGQSVAGQPGKWTLAHEIGHNLGLGHCRFTDCPGQSACTSNLNCVCLTDCDDQDCNPQDCAYPAPQIADLAWGWQFVHSNAIRGTLMTGCLSCAPGGYERIPYFSNPDVNYPNQQGTPTGSTDPSCLADAVLAIVGGTHPVTSDPVYGTKSLVMKYRTSHSTADTTTMVTTAGAAPDFDPVAGDEDSTSPAISRNGQDIAFTSLTGSEWGFDKNGNSGRDVYLFNSEAGTVELISYLSSDRTKSEGIDTAHPAISGNRGTVAWRRTGTGNAQHPDDRRFDQIKRYFRHNYGALGQGTHSIISRASDSSGVPSQPGAVGNGPSDHPAVNFDGDHIAFESDATNLTSENTNGKRQIFARNLAVTPHQTVLLSQSTSGTVANDDCANAAVSETGRFVAFESLAGNLADGATEGTLNVFMRDRDFDDDGDFDESGAGAVRTGRITKAYSGEPTTIPNADSFSVSLSGNGTRMAYQSYASNITPPDQITSTTYSNIIFAAYDPPSGDTVSTTLVSKHHTNNVAANGDHIHPHISTNGKWLTFVSNSSELHSDYNTQAWRVYIVRIHEDSGSFSFAIVRVIDGGEVSDYEPDDSTRPVIAGTGRVVAFDMEYTGTGSEPRQVFVHENAKLRGDFTGDGNIDVFDSLMLLANWCEDTDCCTCCAYDLNGDGQVDDDDLDILLDNWG
jgi:hypothetical protein